jgi:hypothetical protein
MNVSNFMNPAHLFLEIGQDFIRMSNGLTSSELPVQRRPDGRFTEACSDTISAQLDHFINRKAWQPRARVLCATNARGVSLRRLVLPQSNRDELRRLLPLQVESEFPLPPDQLAWGYQPLEKKAAGATNQEVLVAAVRRDCLDEYIQILEKCGATPVFTLAALARTYVCPQPPGIYSVLHLERRYSELITIENGAPVAVRVFSWGLDTLTGTGFGKGNGDEESVSPAALPAQPASFGGIGHLAGERVAPSGTTPCLEQVRTASLGRVLYLSSAGKPPSGLNLCQLVTDALENAVDCQRVDSAPDAAGSLAILGLQRSVDRGADSPGLVFDAKPSNGKAQLARHVPIKFAAIALGLLILALILPYLEAVTLKAHLAHKLAAIKTEQDRLAILDRELDFLQYLKVNEPPYVDALLVLAKAAPPGTRFDSVIMNRRGEVSLRGSLHDGQQVADLRSKLLDSGFFSGVSIDEQTPTPDRQKVNVRLSAIWNPAEKRTVPSLEPGHAPSSSGMPPGMGAPDRPSPVAMSKPANLPPPRN